MEHTRPDGVKDEIADPADAILTDPDEKGLNVLAIIENGKSLVLAGYAREQSRELNPEDQAWLHSFSLRFDQFPTLHEGINWETVEKSLCADIESLKILQALDAKGHQMNVFGLKNGELIFASAWTDVNEVSKDHRDLVFDKENYDKIVEEDRILKEEGRYWLYRIGNWNGHATGIAKSMDVDLADPEVQIQLSKVVTIINGWAYLKTDPDTRKEGAALIGRNNTVQPYYTDFYSDPGGSLRVERRVKLVV